MFIHNSRLPHVLRPELYSCPKQYDLEMVQLFEPAWHVVGSVADAARDGDFLTLNLLGKPIIVRNFQGKFQAFLNVCPHRHSLLTHLSCGNSPELRCQYHGWEFTRDGSTAKIPDAQGFRPIPGGPEKLRAFRTEVRGPMIYVSLSDDSPGLAEQLGPLTEVCDEFPCERWRQSATWKYEFPANWKVVVENTVESYHVPEVHSKTLVAFGREDQTTHEIHDRATVMRSPIVSPAIYRNVTDWLMPLLEPGCSNLYRLHHGFPHLFLIRIDAMLQVMSVQPISPEACRLTVHVFTLRAVRESFHTRVLTRFWGDSKPASFEKSLPKTQYFTRTCIWV